MRVRERSCYQIVETWQRTDVKYSGDCNGKGYMTLPELGRNLATGIASAYGIPVSDFDRCDPRKLIKRRVQLCSEFGCNGAWRFPQPFRQLKRNRQRKLAESDVRRLLNRELRESNLVFCKQDGLNARLKGELNCAIHAYSSLLVPSFSTLGLRRRRLV